jgi:hypothetical protein
MKHSVLRGVLAALLVSARFFTPARGDTATAIIFTQALKSVKASNSYRIARFLNAIAGSNEQLSPMFEFLDDEDKGPCARAFGALCAHHLLAEDVCPNRAKLIVQLGKIDTRDYPFVAVATAEYYARLYDEFTIADICDAADSFIGVVTGCMGSRCEILKLCVGNIRTRACAQFCHNAYIKAASSFSPGSNRNFNWRIKVSEDWCDKNPDFAARFDELVTCGRVLDGSHVWGVDLRDDIEEWAKNTQVGAGRRRAKRCVPPKKRRPKWVRRDQQDNFTGTQ